MSESSALKKIELLFASLQHEKLPAVAWVPFAGVHAGARTGYSAREVLTSKDKDEYLEKSDGSNHVNGKRHVAFAH